MLAGRLAHIGAQDSFPQNRYQSEGLWGCAGPHLTTFPSGMTSGVISWDRSGGRGGWEESWRLLGWVVSRGEGCRGWGLLGVTLWYSAPRTRSLTPLSSTVPTCVKGAAESDLTTWL